MLVHSHFQVLPPFEELVELAHQNPEAFRMLKHDICEETILSASPEVQKRLWAQQQHIDHVLSHCPSSNESRHTRVKPSPDGVYPLEPRNFGHLDKRKAQTTATIIPFPQCANSDPKI